MVIDSARQVLCPICGKPIRCKTLLPAHLETHRNPEERAKERERKALENPQKEPRQRYLCQECGQTFASISNFNYNIFFIICTYVLE